MPEPDVHMARRQHRVPPDWDGRTFLAKVNAAGEVVERSVAVHRFGNPYTPLLIRLDGDRSEFLDGSLVSQEEADRAALALRLTAIQHADDE